MNPATTQSGEVRPTTLRIMGYSLGEAGVAITANALSSFALLFYIQVVGLGATAAGFALSIATLYDAVTDPLMGHISDNTRSRWGRRLPYVAVGGVMTAFFFATLWFLPAGAGFSWPLFAWVIFTNLLLRTALTVFFVPYVALGFELCHHYESRSRLQGMRSVFNMVSNVLFGALAWSIFFSDGQGADGKRLDGTNIAGNYTTMALAFAACCVLLVACCVWSMKSMATDNRSSHPPGNSLPAFWRDFSQVLRDRLGWQVFAFFAVAHFGMLLVSQVQMFTYVNFLQLAAGEKTLIHGAGMVAFALGALLQAWITKRWDKKRAGFTGMVVSSIGAFFLLFIYFGLHLEPRAIVSAWDIEWPVSLLLFGAGQVAWWGGCGIIGPIAMSMMADLSEANYLRTGELKDGSYSAIFSFLQKAAMSGGILVTGWIVTMCGIVPGASEQSPAAAKSMALMTFLPGPVMMFLAFLLLRSYPVDRAFLHRLADQYGRVAKDREGQP
jgi:GPH family glycoside/pentoside/hexuronide:cation symporter